jgi:hypothetical protein
MPSSVPSSLLRALSAFGLGLSTWTAVTIALLQFRGGATTSLQPLQWLALSIGGVLVLVGLIAAPARRRLRARAETPRSAWTVRAARLSLLVLVLTAPLVLVLQTGLAIPARGVIQTLLAIAVLATCVATAVAAGLGEREDTPTAAWRHPLALPIQLLTALTGGLALLYLLMSLLFPTGRDVGAMLLTLTVLGGLLALCLWVQWRELDRGTGTGRDTTRGRRDATRRRVLTAGLFLGSPLAAWLLSGLRVVPAPALLLATSVGLLAAAAVARGLLAAPGSATAGHVPAAAPAP